MLLKDVLKNIKVYETNGEIDGVEITSLTLDNRKCVPGSAFFAIRGLVNDGHNILAVLRKTVRPPYLLRNSPVTRCFR